MSNYQVVVYGATSFVGQILSRYLFQRHGAGGEFRWALAGRSESKLRQVRDSLGAGSEKLPLIVADAADETALRGLCDATDVVISTVGPYALYGSLLVQLCAESGTDYCDLTGEPQWIARMIAAHEETAKRSGARIVHCCGYDSIPSDLGVHFLQQAALRDFGEPCTRVKMRVKKLRGGFSGGTAASLMNAVAESARDPAVRRMMSDPYGICPPDTRGKVKQPNVVFAEYDEDAKSWLSPFVMAAINTRVVHRSNALSSFAYGADFRYDEAVMTGPGLKGRLMAAGTAIGLGAFVAATAIGPTRKLLEKIVPQAGEGPTPEQQEKGLFDHRVFGETASGRKLVVKVTGDRDPGYGSTGKMLGEAGACLALDRPAAEVPGGFWTPATALGDALVQRLVAHAGLTFERVS